MNAVEPPPVVLIRSVASVFEISRPFLRASSRTFCALTFSSAVAIWAVVPVAFAELSVVVRFDNSSVSYLISFSSFLTASGLSTLFL